MESFQYNSTIEFFGLFLKFKHPFFNLILTHFVFYFKGSFKSKAEAEVAVMDMGAVVMGVMEVAVMDMEAAAAVADMSR